MECLGTQVSQCRDLNMFQDRRHSHIPRQTRFCQVMVSLSALAIAGVVTMQSPFPED